jgi:hypothetical protein
MSLVEKIEDAMDRLDIVSSQRIETLLSELEADEEDSDAPEDAEDEDES